MHTSYIQINIYGDTLDSLRSRNLDLKSLLNSNGLQTVQITEMPIPALPIPQLPTSSSSDSDTPESMECEMTLGQIIGVRPYKMMTTEIRKGDPIDLGGLLQQDETGEEADSGLLKPKEEIIEEDDEEYQEASTSNENNETAEMGDGSLSQLLSTLTANGLFDAANGLLNNKNEDETGESSSPNLSVPIVRRRNLSRDDADAWNKAHSIACGFPLCTHTYAWKVKYGKLRLVDHALTHVPGRRISCHLCDHYVQNVRQMRTHYQKSHPNERPVGYGMKDMPISDEEMRLLWRRCYAAFIPVIGEASSATALEKQKRIRRIAPKLKSHNTA